MKIINYFKSLYRKFFVFIKSKKLKNKDFSLISNNCCGGIIYHDLGLKFTSPTINLFYEIEDYLTFLENLKECLTSPILEVKDGERNFAVGKIVLSSKKSIKIYFQHYKTFEEARDKFYERTKRINFDNLFILLELGILTTDELVKRFNALPFKNKAVITNKEYSDCVCAIKLDIYGEDYCWGKILKRIPKTMNSKRYLDLFNYINWFNTGRVERIKNYDKFLKRF